MIKKNKTYSIHFGLGLLCIFNAVVLFTPPAVSKSEAIEFEVSALCEPHSDLLTPSKISVQFVYQSTVLSSTPQMWAYLDLPGGTRLSSNQIQLGQPQSGWVTSVFEGPPIKGTVYCENVYQNTKKLNLSYYPSKHIILGSNHAELDHIQGIKHNWVLVKPSLNQNNHQFKAGKDSLTPYTFQISVPLQSNLNTSKTQLKYTYQ